MKKKPLTLDEVPAHARHLFQFDNQRAIHGHLHIQIICPSCGLSRWRTVSHIRTRMPKTFLCKSCSRGTKPLEPNEVPVAFQPCFDFDHQARRGGKLYIRVTCPDCGKSRWRRPTVFRTGQSKSPRCQKCACHDRGTGRFISRGYVCLLKSYLDSADQALADAMTARWYIFEHRLVMSRFLGRALRSNERVHHRNADRQDNRIGNLRLITPSTHPIAPNDLVANLSVEIEDKARELQYRGITPLPVLNQCLKQLLAAIDKAHN